jgi:hypothetical protein
MDILYLVIAVVFFVATAIVVAKLPDFKPRREQ